MNECGIKFSRCVAKSAAVVKNLFIAEEDLMW